MTRPSRDETMMDLARVIARRSTCVRRGVGAVAVDAHGRLLSAGHNGVPMGDVHCTDAPCAGSLLKSGEGLDACKAVHAEANCLLFCPDVMRIETIYVTASPCLLCVRLLLNTSCQLIVYDELYSEEALFWWHARGRRTRKLA